MHQLSWYSVNYINILLTPKDYLNLYYLLNLDYKLNFDSYQDYIN